MSERQECSGCWYFRSMPVALRRVGALSQVSICCRTSETVYLAAGLGGHLLGDYSRFWCAEWRPAESSGSD